jgi:hypothetical protein
MASSKPTPVIGHMDESNDGFPYVVIEYFNHDTHKRPSDIDLRIRGNTWENQMLFNGYNEENDQFTKKRINIRSDDSRVFPKR